MSYCPYCSASIKTATKVCPYCKKTIDITMLSELYNSAESSELNKKMSLRIWMKEKALIFYPLVSFILGGVLGALLIYGYAMAEFASQKEEFIQKIAGLEEKINTSSANMDDVKNDMNKVIENKNKIVNMLIDQQQLLSNIFIITRDLLNKSTLIIDNDQEKNDYIRKFNYYQNQYTKTNEDIAKLDNKLPVAINLVTVPQAFATAKTDSVSQP